MNQRYLPVALSIMVFTCFWGTESAAAPVAIANLRCEYLENPLGMDVTRPRLSWRLESDQRGQRQTAYHLVDTFVNKTTYPGWGYMVENGTTTCWEQWNGYYSQIHSCFPYIGGWFYRGLAGIRWDPDAPGFQQVILRPALVKSVDWVECSYHGLPDDPGHAVAVTQVRGFGGMLGFETESISGVKGNVRFCRPWTSLGDVETLINHYGSGPVPAPPKKQFLVNLLEPQPASFYV